MITSLYNITHFLATQRNITHNHQLQQRPEPPTTDETDEDVQINSNDEDGINIRREYDNMEWKYLAQDSVYWEQLEEAFVRL